MRDFLILITEMFGYALILGFVATILNYYFDLNLGVYGVSTPNDPYVGVYFLILGLIVTAVGHFLNKKYPSSPTK